MVTWFAPEAELLQSVQSPLIWVRKCNGMVSMGVTYTVTR
jgi:hypothetical protein